MTQQINENNSIQFNFTYYAMRLLGKNLYSSPWTAVSELVANGIDSKADKVHVLVDMRDKEHAVVEIFDNGMGMSYEDLRDKYTLIGRNKRESEDNIEGKTLGRKGIGKLAALYLSSKYFLYTKTRENQSAWVIDTSNYKDSDIPTMNNVEWDDNILIASELWNKNKTGTMIHLSNVDLRKIGPERLKKLPLILADYYLETRIDCRILVCVLADDSSEFVFKEIKKSVNFDTIYAIFDNTDLGYKNKIQPQLYITKKNAYPEVDFPRVTQIIDSNKFGCEDKMSLVNLQGLIVDLPYKLEGWIGIHCSLDKEVLERNSPGTKKIRPNALRLYVRGKLAVDNLMNYIGSTQALASYIEGEISFDALDDDLFEDASTSNREGYSLSDPRVKKLIDITKKIVRALIDERTSIGNKINTEVEEAKEKRLKEEEDKKRLAEQRAVEEKKKAEQAEKQKQTAETKAKFEQKMREEVEKERDMLKKDSEKDKQRLFVLENNFSSNGECYKHGIHLAVNYAKEIRGIISDLEEGLSDQTVEVVNSIMAVDRSAEKIERLPQYIDTVNFSLTSPKIKLDIVEFIRQYVESKGNPKLSYEFQINTCFVREFDFPEILMLVENIISNSVKAKAKKLQIIARRESEALILEFSDDGRGLDAKFIGSPDDIFELGVTTSIGGFGIGCYHMKKIISSLNGEIHAIQNTERGMTIKVIIRE